MIKFNHFILTLLLVLSHHAAFADDKQNFNQVNLQVTVSEDIANDQLIAMLVVQETGNDPASLANKVNDKMAKIIAKVDHFKMVEHQTINYNSQPIYKNGSIKSWKVSQNIRFKSQNFDQLGKLIAQVNQLSTVQSMNFGLSDSQIEKTQDRLTKDAIVKFRHKASGIAKQFGKSSYHLVHINVGSNYVQQPRQRMMRSSMAKESMADSAPALSAGSNTISVNVNGTVELF
jgi:predicted secreted protein